MATRERKEFTGEEIRRIREALGMEQVEFAEQLGVSQAAISLWENGFRSPSGSACILLEQLAENLPKKMRR